MIHHLTHWDHVREMGCCVCLDNTQVTIHHCHGGSIKEFFGIVGMGQRQNHMLVIPLCAMHHVGDWGIDSCLGVREWEKYFGTQLHYLKRVGAQIKMLYGYDIFNEAGVPKP